MVPLAPSDASACGVVVDPAPGPANIKMLHVNRLQWEPVRPPKDGGLLAPGETYVAGTARPELDGDTHGARRAGDAKGEGEHAQPQPHRHRRHWTDLCERRVLRRLGVSEALMPKCRVAMRREPLTVLYSNPMPGRLLAFPGDWLHSVRRIRTSDGIDVRLGGGGGRGGGGGWFGRRRLRESDGGGGGGGGESGGGGGEGAGEGDAEAEGDAAAEAAEAEDMGAAFEGDKKRLVLLVNYWAEAMPGDNLITGGGGRLRPGTPPHLAAKAHRWCGPPKLGLHSTGAAAAAATGESAARDGPSAAVGPACFSCNVMWLNSTNEPRVYCEGRRGRDFM